MGRGEGSSGSVFSELRDLVRVYRGVDVFGERHHRDPGVAVVLGAQVRRGGRPSGTLLARTRHAARLYLRGEVGLVLPTGGLGEHGPAEAEVMAEILRREGVPEGAILPEDRAKSTWDSGRYVAALARKRGLENLLVVTDPLHCVRTLGTFQAEGLTVHASPAYESPMWRNGVLRRGQFMREAVAIVGYRARRWLGNG